MKILINPTEVTTKPKIGRFNEYMLDVVDNSDQVLGVLSFEYTWDSVEFSLLNFGRIYKITIHRSNIKNVQIEDIFEQLLNEANMTMRHRDTRS